MTLLPTAQPLPKHKDRVVIAHISDLHFTASTDRGGPIWKALCEDFQRISTDVDLLAVTGDVIDSSVPDNLGKNGVRNALQKVRNYLLQDLCTAAAVDPSRCLMVVPGNHDFRITGLIWKKSQFDLFHREFGCYFSPRLFQNLGLSVFTFDSNSPDRPLNFASGLVDKNDLIEHSGMVREITENHPQFWSNCTRVVLIHHHPMPIAPTQHRENAQAGEEFMLLKNAGQFMEQMVKTKMDLVLHGHRHYPAYSRVSFPTSEGMAHSIAIVGAGSVGRAGDDHLSYNVVTISRSKELRLERRMLTGVTYDGGKFFVISNYEEAREKSCQTKHDGRPQFRVDKYLRVDTICAGSGDAVVDETFYGAQSLSADPISEMPRTVKSRSGVFGEWVYETPDGHKIEWKWDGPPTDGNRRGRTTLDPPLGKDPLTFSRHGTTFNAIHFNQKDRLDSTDQKDKEEWTYMNTRHIYDIAVLQVNFPRDSFPKDFRVEVTRPDEKTRDYQEEEFLRHRLTRFPSTSSVVLTLPKPIPDCSYRIRWDLPANDNEELNLDAVDQGLAANIVRKLLSLREPESPLREPVQKALAHLRDTILSVPTYSSPVGDDQLELELFAYDAQAGGLVFVAILSEHINQLPSCVIKPGRYVVGQAFRRREEVVLINLPGVRTEGAAYYEPIPGTDHLPPHTAIFSLPLFYPIRKGAKVGALALCSRSDTSGLLCLHRGRLEKDRAAFDALRVQLAVWYAEELAEALGLKPLAV